MREAIISACGKIAKLMSDKNMGGKRDMLSDNLQNIVFSNVKGMIRSDIIPQISNMATGVMGEYAREFIQKRHDLQKLNEKLKQVAAEKSEEGGYQAPKVNRYSDTSQYTETAAKTKLTALDSLEKELGTKKVIRDVSISNERQDVAKLRTTNPKLFGKEIAEYYKAHPELIDQKLGIKPGLLYAEDNEAVRVAAALYQWAAEKAENGAIAFAEKYPRTTEFLSDAIGGVIDFGGRSLRNAFGDERIDDSKLVLEIAGNYLDSKLTSEQLDTIKLFGWGKLALEGGLGAAKLTSKLTNKVGIHGPKMDTIGHIEELTHPSTPVGHKQREIVVEAGSNSRTSIYGREYSGHALDRMQERGLTPTMVEHVIQNGEQSLGNMPNRIVHYDFVNKVKIVTEGGNVITVRFGE